MTCRKGHKIAPPPPPSPIMPVAALADSTEFPLSANQSTLARATRHLFQYPSEEDNGAYFVDYTPPARDTLHLPKHVLYLIMGALVVLTVVYVIVSHLIDDLIHDLADWLLGPNTEEERKQHDGGGQGDVRNENTKDEEVLRLMVERRGVLPMSGVLSERALQS